MRVTSQTKAATRSRILKSARRLFSADPDGATTTRDIARAAGIATGTLFNYFPTREAVVACLANQALGTPADHDATRPASASHATTLEEDLFSLVAAGLRKLKPLRAHLPSLLETTLSPLAIKSDPHAAAFRTTHLDALLAAARRHGHADLSPTALQLYWTLYTGILSFWTADTSPKQEETLALIDDSITMFVGWLSKPAPSRPTRTP